MTGVSWYEAAAYAEFRDMSLPTVYHWASAATGYGVSGSIVELSNFAEAPAPVGRHDGMNLFGTYDMAGNAREWVWNEVAPGNDRYILGGAWNDPAYKFFEIDARSPLDRSSGNGFRLALHDDPAAVAQLTQPIEPVTRDYRQEQPVADDVFEFYRSQYAYDPAPLDAVGEGQDDSAEHWTREVVNVRAAYDNERLPMVLALPKGVSPPYQAVVSFPGSGAVGGESPEYFPENMDYILQSGRAALLPVYFGTYERTTNNRVMTFPDETQSYRDWVIRQMKDARRAVDFLTDRADIDSDRIAYLGYSWGGEAGPLVLALEPRLRAGIFVVGGFWLGRSLPEVDPFNFAPRVKVPVLMLNGEQDFIFPKSSSQEPMFDLLGTPKEDKVHTVIPDAGHSIEGTHRSRVMREILDWLDKYLGPVN